MFIVGGPRAWRVRHLHDVSVAYHWIEHEPAMVLFRLADPRSAFVVTLAKAYEYADARTGQPTVELFNSAARALKVLGFHSQDKFALHRIADVIVEGLPDLVEMPPEPDWTKAGEAAAVPVGELTVKAGGRAVHESVVTAPDMHEAVPTLQ